MESRNSTTPSLVAHSRGLITRPSQVYSAEVHLPPAPPVITSILVRIHPTPQRSYSNLPGSARVLSFSTTPYRSSLAISASIRPPRFSPRPTVYPCVAQPCVHGQHVHRTHLPVIDRTKRTDHTSAVSSSDVAAAGRPGEPRPRRKEGYTGRGCAVGIANGPPPPGHG